MCLTHDYIIREGEIADDMYFIKKGYVEVISTDMKTIIAYLGEGCYFGEVGIFLTDKRSCTVKAKTACIFLTITKRNLITILESYPKQLKFLKAVARQRLETTKPEDLMNASDSTISEMMDVD